MSDGMTIGAQREESDALRIGVGGRGVVAACLIECAVAAVLAVGMVVFLIALPGDIRAFSSLRSGDAAVAMAVLVATVACVVVCGWVVAGLADRVQRDRDAGGVGAPEGGEVRASCARGDRGERRDAA